MAKIDENSIAKLKSLFQDNEKALGSNFSQLIDFFNDNKVTDNGDGTFTVGTIMVDASKLFDLINNSSPNILPLDNEFTGKNTFDIAPINKANGKPYITADSVPPVDLSNYPTKDQLATKADTSAIDQSVMIKNTLTADDDVLTLDPGTYYAWGVKPKNYPELAIWSTIVVKTISNKPLDGKNVTITDVNAGQMVNTYSGGPNTWSGWRVPNSTTMASKSDVTTAISTATANMVDSTKATNFTAGLQSGGVDVATAADLKSIEASAWHEVSLPDSTILKNAHFMYRSEFIDAHYNIPFILIGTVYVPQAESSNGVTLLDLSSYLPISKDDYKNYTVNSVVSGPGDRTFDQANNADFSPNYFIPERLLGIKIVNSDLVLYSTGSYAYFRTSTSSRILLGMSSDSKALPTIHFVPSTKS